MRFCKTTPWIKKSVLFFKDMTLTSFGPFSTDLRRSWWDSWVRHHDLDQIRSGALTRGRRAASVA